MSEDEKGNRASEAAPDLDWITPDTLVEYQASKAQGRWYAAVVDGWPRSLGSSTVVRLREVEPAYSRDHHPGQNRTTIIAASVDCVRPRPNEPSPKGCMLASGHPGPHVFGAILNPDTLGVSERCSTATPWAAPRACHICGTTTAKHGRYCSASGVPSEWVTISAASLDAARAEADQIRTELGIEALEQRPPEAKTEQEDWTVQNGHELDGSGFVGFWASGPIRGSRSEAEKDIPRTDHPRPISECPECHEDVGAGDPHVDMCSRPALAMWRVGRKLGRTIYWGDVLHGMVDLPEIAKRICDAMNAAESRPETASPKLRADLDAWVERFIRPHFEGKCDGLTKDDCVETIRLDLERLATHEKGETK